MTMLRRFGVPKTVLSCFANSFLQSLDVSYEYRFKPSSRPCSLAPMATPGYVTLACPTGAMG